MRRAEGAIAAGLRLETGPRRSRHGGTAASPRSRPGSAWTRPTPAPCRDAHSRAQAATVRYELSNGLSAILPGAAVELGNAGASGGFAVLGQPDAAEDQGERDGVEEPERLVEDEERQDRGEYRHQVDEHARPAWPDQRDPLDEADLRQEGREQRDQARGSASRPAVGHWNRPSAASASASGSEVTNAAPAMPVNRLSGETGGRRLRPKV